MQLTGLCRDHSFEPAEAVCRQCGLEFCSACIVHPFGKKKPICKSCAVNLSGVRTGSGRAPMNPRLLKRRVKEFEKLLEAKKTGPQGEDATTLIVSSQGIEMPGNFSDDGASHQSNEPAHVGGGIDWSNPFA